MRVIECCEEIAMNEPKSGLSEDAQRVLDIAYLKQHIVDKDLEKIESRFEGRINDVKTDCHQDISHVRGEVAQVKADLEKDIREVQTDLRDDIKGIRAHITALTVLDVTSLLALIGLIITVLLK